jgi:hypothetical protein
MFPPELRFSRYFNGLPYNIIERSERALAPSDASIAFNSTTACAHVRYYRVR